MKARRYGGAPTKAWANRLMTTGRRKSWLFWLLACGATAVVILMVFGSYQLVLEQWYIHRIETSTTEETQLASARALGRLGSVRGGSYLLDKYQSEVKTEKLSVPGPEIYRFAWRIFECVRNEHSDTFIFSAFSEFEKPVVRSVALWVRAIWEFVMASTVEVVPFLETQVGQDDPCKRRLCAVLLGGLAFSTEEAKVALIRLVGSGDPSVRYYAVKYLEMIGPAAEEAAPALIGALDDILPIRFYAAGALEEIGSKDAVPALLRMLEGDPDGGARGAAADALGRIGSRGAVPALARALENDSDERVRYSAAEALGEIGVVSDLVLDAVRRAKKQDKDEEVRTAASEALEALRGLAE